MPEASFSTKNDKHFLWVRTNDPSNFMNNLTELFLPVKGDRRPFQPGQPGQSTQADLEKRKKSSVFKEMPSSPSPPPPLDVGRAWGGRAVIMIILIIIGIFAVLIALGS